MSYRDACPDCGIWGCSIDCRGPQGPVRQCDGCGSDMVEPITGHLDCRQCREEARAIT